MMKKGKDVQKKQKNIEKHKKSRSSWYSNKYQTILVQRNILFIFAIITVVSMSLSVILLKYMVSSKSLEPYVIEIEDKTGIATVVDQSTTQEFTANEAVKKYFINKFIQSAVAYDYRTYKKDREIVRLMSSKSVNTTISRTMTQNYNKYSYNSIVSIRIKSVTFPNSAVARVRVKKNIKTKNGSTITKNELVTLSFKFSPEIKLKKEERLINPLGFQVVSYLISEEIFDY